MALMSDRSPWLGSGQQSLPNQGLLLRLSPIQQGECHRASLFGDAYAPTV
ncbi:hypothetical protein [Phormidium tenue]|nr:hypothetical protein [Phormidium tenue]MBD2230195.1 hypothetical protein [Phormidium tenue FACHB-1052]